MQPLSAADTEKEELMSGRLSQGWCSWDHASQKTQYLIATNCKICCRTDAELVTALRRKIAARLNWPYDVVVVLSTGETVIKIKVGSLRPEQA
jgi:hypothetical protein